MSEDDMRSYLIETNKHSDMLKTFNEAVDITTNIQQAWLTECVVFNPVGQHRFGKRIDNKTEQNSTHPFADWDKLLYASYLDFAHGVSSGKPSAMGLMRFKAWLLDELQNVLRLNVNMIKKGNCYELHGISLRDSYAARKPGIYALPASLTVG